MGGPCRAPSPCPSSLRPAVVVPAGAGGGIGRPGVGFASRGFDPGANRLANQAPAFLGPMVYAYAALRAMVVWRVATFDVTVDRERRTFKGWTVAAANGNA